EPCLGTIKWIENGGALIWALLEEMQVPANRLVLFGKTEGSDEGTKGDSKIIVYKRIGKTILPQLFKTSPNALAKRVKGKAEDLLSDYKTHAKRLQVTGEGIKNDDDDDYEDVDQFLPCYISKDGPDHDTTAAALNIW
ncbi:hypothetical protein C8J57DRAFT_1586076, partial [Mycena rebaudengoi]